MKNEIAKRKKRFLAISIILTLLLCNLTPFTVFAETYTDFQLTSTPMYEPDKQNLVNAGDILQLFGGKNPQTYNGNYAIQYLDTNESPLYLELAPEANGHNEADWYYETQVLDYSSAGGRAIPAEQFKCWQVTYLYVSAGWSGEITLKAIPYSEFAITYELDGGVNSPANPSAYYEGKADIPLENATKSGYSFDGWYTDAAFSTQVTAISAEQTGNITLYAKFTPNPVVSSITYVLDGGSNGEGNPDSYTEGTGVPSFSDASKTGYSFGGWFSDAAFTNKVTSISPEQTGEVTLYAKFTFIPLPTQNLTQTPTPVPTQTPTLVPTQTSTPIPTQTLAPVSTQTPTSVPTQTPIPAEQKENSYPPKTADRTPIIPLLFIMGISSTVAMMAILLKRKREK